MFLTKSCHSSYGEKKIHEAISSTRIKAGGGKELNSQHLYIKISPVRVFVQMATISAREENGVRWKLGRDR
jgi:hypothetical protein